MESQYEKRVKAELLKWEKTILSRAGIFERMSRGVQKKVDRLIPEKVHQTFTKAMEVAVKSVLTGINLIPINKQKLAEARTISLAEIDDKVDAIINRYQKIGAAGGAGTGAGGILLVAVDYPTLISLKLKMLQEIAQTFGYNIKEKEERIFLLKVFLLAFSRDKSRKKVYFEIQDWDQRVGHEATINSSEKMVDWRELYVEYRESIDFKKLLQVVPGVGAVVGAWANYSLIEELGEVARNSYRLRYFNRDIQFYEFT